MKSTYLGWGTVAQRQEDERIHGQPELESLKNKTNKNSGTLNGVSILVVESSPSKTMSWVPSLALA